MKVRLLVLTSLAVALVGGGCSSSTKIVQTWRDPVFHGPIDFKRTLVVAIDPDRYSRNVAEDTVVERIGRDRAVAAHDVLAENERKASQQVVSKLRSEGIDGVVTIAVVGSRTIVSRDTSAAESEPFYTYYDRSAAFLMTDPGTRTDTVYRVETRIYAVDGSRLLWSAASETVNPKDTRTAVIDIAKAVGDELRKQKLIR
jgi:hypothetical protein